MRFCNGCILFMIKIVQFPLVLSTVSLDVCSCVCVCVCTASTISQTTVTIIYSSFIKDVNDISLTPLSYHIYFVFAILFSTFSYIFLRCPLPHITSNIGLQIIMRCISSGTTITSCPYYCMCV